MIERHSNHHYSFGPYQLDPVRRVLLCSGKMVPIAPKAFEMLLLLVENNGRVLGKQELLEYLWPGSIVEEANLSQTIYLLRRALTQNSDGQQFIETIPKLGYRFVAEVVVSVNEKASSENELINQPQHETVNANRIENGQSGSFAAITELPVPKSSPYQNKWIRVGALALLLGIMGFASYLWLSRQSAKPYKLGPINSLAVLPFEPIKAGNEDNYLGLGMADVLITRLSSLDKIVVQPTSAIRKYDALGLHPIDAGRELNVDAVLEGTLQKTDDRLRVTLRLHDVRDGRTVWSGKFDEKFTDIFIVQDLISDQVASALTLNLSRDKRALMLKHYTENSEAYELYLKGRYWWNRRTSDGLKKAIGNFEKAITLSPNYALAYAGLADCYNLLNILEAMPPEESFPKAKSAAAKALELDDTLAEAHVALGRTKWVYDWDWNASQSEFKRAIELSPNYATAYDQYGVCLAQRGQFEEALRQLKQAQQLDPLSLVTQVHIGWVYFYSGQYDLAIDQYNRVLEMDPGYFWARAHLSQAYEQKGMYVQAIAELQQVLERSSETSKARHLAGMAHVYGVSGRSGEAKGILDDLLRLGKERPVSPYSIALVYAGLGDGEQAFAWLNRAVERHTGLLVRLRFDHRFKKLRNDSRFEKILSQINPLLPSAGTLSSNEKTGR